MAASAAVMVASSPARADGPSLTTRATANQVEVGEPFRVELKAMVEQGDSMPSDPQIRPPGGFSVNGPSISSQTFINGIGRNAQVSVGMGATWELTGSKVGKFTIPAPSVVWKGKRYAGQKVTIEVVAPSGRPHRGGRNNNPFLLPGGMGGFFPPGFPGSGSDPFEVEERAPTTDPGTPPNLQLDKAPDPTAFIYAIADKKTAVVGEQVILSFYLYYSEDLRLLERHEVPLVDFTSVSMDKGIDAEPHRQIVIGGKRFRANLFNRVAIFPLHPGDLHTGTMKMTIAAGRRGVPGERESNDVVLKVTEPPKEGRPPGYVLGDVGKLTLGSSVAPRKIEQGGTLSVTLKITGEGNFPQALKVPERTGVEWLDPERRESIEADNKGVKGWRSFGYVVRLKDSGTIDLGEVALPYWNVATQHYEIAKASLGMVEVTPVMPAIDPNSKKPIDEARENDPFATLPSARNELSSYTPKGPRLIEGKSIWLAALAPPLAVGLFSAGAGAAKRARTKRAAQKDSPARLAEVALEDAAAAEKKGDVKALAASVERAVHLAVEGATGLKSRGVLLADLTDELEERGLSADLAGEVKAVLAACEELRFVPAMDAGASGELLRKARAAVTALARHKAS